MSLWRKVVIVAMALTLLVSGWSTPILHANAQSASESFGGEIEQIKFEQMSYTASTTSDIKDPQKIQQLKDIAKDAISSKSVELNFLSADLDFNDAKYLKISENNENYASVTIPIVGEHYSLISNLTLIFDPENKFISYSETLITKSDNNKFVVTTYLDGKLIQVEETDIDYISNSELQKELEIMQNIDSDIFQAQKSFNEIALCISVVALVDLTIARLIATTCIASCPAAPPICAACIGAVAVVGAGNIPAIISCFK